MFRNIANLPADPLGPGAATPALSPFAAVRAGALRRVSGSPHPREIGRVLEFWPFGELPFWERVGRSRKTGRRGEGGDFETSRIRSPIRWHSGSSLPRSRNWQLCARVRSAGFRGVSPGNRQFSEISTLPRAAISGRLGRSRKTELAWGGRRFRAIANSPADPLGPGAVTPALSPFAAVRAGALRRSSGSFSGKSADFCRFGLPRAAILGRIARSRKTGRRGEGGDFETSRTQWPMRWIPGQSLRRSLNLLLCARMRSAGFRGDPPGNRQICEI